MSAMNPDSSRIAAYDAEMAAAHASLVRSAPSEALAQLERAHVLGQRDFGRHWRVHVTMLRAAWALRDVGELRGQWLRLSLVPLGHLFGRLPLPERRFLARALHQEAVGGGILLVVACGRFKGGGSVRGV